MKIRVVDDKIWAINNVVSSQDDMVGILDEFEFNQIAMGKYEKHEYLPKNTPRWNFLAKSNDSIGDNMVLINLAEKCKYIARKILQKDLELVRVNTNIQAPHQDASFHQDGGPKSWTFLIFVGLKWDSNWGGEFLCKTEETYVSVPFIPGNGALFNGNLEHRGSASNGTAYLSRITVAFTYEELE